MKRQPTPQHITWFLDLVKNKQIDLNPSYQRKSVWTPKDRRFFLDTIFRNYPAPPIFFHREISDSGQTTYHVVDGKQRLETIINFSEDKIAMDKGFGDENLDGKKFKDLSIDYKRKFWDYLLVVDFIDDVGGNNIKEVFDRVNRNSKNLEPQELRHARFDGWFITETEKESEESFWWDSKVNTRAKEKRMKNIQLISELLLITLEKKIVGFSQEYLDEMYAKYDVIDDLDEPLDLDEYIAKKTQIKLILFEMNQVNKCIEIFGKTANNLYTLWAVISLNIETVPSGRELAERYEQFMKSVQGYIETALPTDLAPITNPTPLEATTYTYYANSKGASTEEPQRKMRYIALTQFLLTV
jgi:hypothetical protein